MTTLAQFCHAIAVYETRNGRPPFQIHVSRQTWRNMLNELGLDPEVSLYGRVHGIRTFVEASVPDEAIDFLEEEAESHR